MILIQLQWYYWKRHIYPPRGTSVPNLNKKKIAPDKIMCLHLLLYQWHWYSSSDTNLGGTSMHPGGNICAKAQSAVDCLPPPNCLHREGLLLASLFWHRGEGPWQGRRARSRSYHSNTQGQEWLGSSAPPAPLALHWRPPPVSNGQPECSKSVPNVFLILTNQQQLCSISVPNVCSNSWGCGSVMANQIAAFLTMESNGRVQPGRFSGTSSGRRKMILVSFCWKSRHDSRNVSFIQIHPVEAEITAVKVPDRTGPFFGHF